MIRRTFWTMLLLSFVNSLLAADPWIGVWKMNVAKSTFPPGREVKEMTVTVAEQGEDAAITGRVVTAAGTVTSSKYTIPFKGGTAKFTEGGPPPGSILAGVRVDVKTLRFTLTMNGRQVQQDQTVLSTDGKSFTQTTAGVDQSGKTYKTVQVFERQ